MGTQAILESALKLDPAERLALAEEILRSLDRPDPDIDRLWIEEAERRLEAYRQGRAQAVPAEDIVGPC